MSTTRISLNRSPCRGCQYETVDKNHNPNCRDCHIIAEFVRLSYDQDPTPCSEGVAHFEPWHSMSSGRRFHAKPDLAERQ
jgi:hypothetical protein